MADQVIDSYGKGDEEVLIRNRDVAGYMSEDFYQALYGWSMVKKWGLPVAGGWAEQPKLFMDAIDAIENAYNEWENEQLAKNNPAPPNLSVKG